MPLKIQKVNKGTYMGGIEGLGHFGRITVSQWNAKPQGENNDSYWNIAANTLGIGATDAEIAQVMNEIINLNEQSAQQNSELNTTLQEGEQILIPMQAQIDEANALIDSVTNEYNVAVQKVQSATQAVNSANANVQNAQSALSAAQNIPVVTNTDENGNKTTDTSARDAAIAAAQAQLAQAQAELAQAQAELEQAQSEMQAKQDMITETTSSLQDLKAQYQQAQSEGENNAAQVQQMIDDINTQVQDKQQELQSLEQQKAQEEEQIRSQQEAQQQEPLNEITETPGIIPGAAVNEEDSEESKDEEEDNNENKNEDYKELLNTMEKELEAQKGKLEASQKSAGLWDKTKEFVSGIFTDNKEETYEKQKQALDKALESGDINDINNAYREIYSDKVNDNGEKIGNLSQEELQKQIDKENNEILEAQEVIENIKDGYYAMGGREISIDDVNEILEKQLQSVVDDLDDAKNNQGIISKGVSGINNFLGFGTSKNDAIESVEQMSDMVEKLADCKDTDEYAAVYKAITGKNFDIENLEILLNYDENNEETDCFNVLADTDSAKSIQSYIDTTETMKDVSIAIGAAALAAATGGTSLIAMGAIGAGVTVGANGVDSIYDSDNNGSLDFNYSAKEIAKDAALGALNGISGGFSNKIGSAATAKLASSFADDIIATTAKEAFKKTAVEVGSKLAGAAIEGTVDGTISSSGAYLIDVAAKDKEFSAQELGQTALLGAGTGFALSTGLSAVGQGISQTATHLNATKFADDINAALKGNSNGNDLADLVASKLDDTLLDGGQVNKYAVKELMENANASYNALARLGLSDESALKILNNCTLEMQKDMPKLTTAIKNCNLHDVKLNSADDIKKVLDNIEDFSLNKTSGQIESLTIKNGDDTLSLKFDEQGKLLENESIRSYKVNGEVVEDFLGDFTSKLDELEKAGMINKVDINSNISQTAQMNNALKNDIDRLYTAYRKGLDVKDAFVPAFENVDDAIAKLNTGDTCRILGSKNIGIKLTDGTIKELNIDADKYLELFPPVEKYAIQQGQIGDCYLVSSLYTLESNPATRAKILECFTQNPDGSIEVKLPNSKSSVNIEAGKQITNYAKQVDLANSCEGIKALEYAYGVDLQFNQTELSQGHLTNALNTLQEQNEWADFWKLISDKQTLNASEVAELKESFKNLKFGDAKMGDYVDDVVDKRFGAIVKETDDGYSLNTEYILNEFDKRSKQIAETQGLLQDINKRLDELATGGERELRGHGGSSHNVYKMFGLDAGYYYSNVDVGINQLSNPDNWDDYIFSIGTKGTSDKKFLNENLKIAQNHAYSVDPFKSETGEILFKVTNPWNTTSANVLTIDELKEYANTVYYAKIH